MSQKRPKRQAQQTETSEKSRPRIIIEAKGAKQKDCLHSLFTAPCVVCLGPAGVGKTFLAASVAAKDLAEKRINKIILSRANVPTGRSLGAFKGTVAEKMAPWLMPLTDVLRLQLGSGFYDWACSHGAIEIQPFETIRGRSFDDAIILMDESQQLTKSDIMAITTRIGKYSKLFMMGDSKQRDIEVDGLEWLKGVANRHNLPVDVHTFTSADVVRSDICKDFVMAYEAEEEDHGRI